MDASRGFFYIATGRESNAFVLRSIDSLRAAGNEEPVRAWTDSPDLYGGFRSCEPVAVAGADGFETRGLKTAAYGLSPWGVTVFLDADTLVLGGLRELWDFAGDVAMAADFFVPRVSDRVSQRYYRDGVDGEAHPFPDPTATYFNSGMIAWRRSPRVETLFALWHELWAKYRGTDQYLLAIALDRLGIGVTPLPGVYNCADASLWERSRASGVKILHGYGNNKDRLLAFDYRSAVSATELPAGGVG